MRSNKDYKDDINFEDPRLLAAIENLDIYELLDENDISYALEGKNIGEKFIGLEFCPTCEKDNFHFGIHKEKLFGSCLVCKSYYPPLSLVAKIKRTSLKKAFDFLIEDSEYEMNVEDRIKQIFKTNRVQGEDTYRGIDPLPENKPITKEIIKHNKVLKSFLKDRKLRIWDVLKYDIRVDKNKIIFPIYVGEKLVSYQTRMMTYKKYHIPQNLSKYLLWEDEINNKKTTVVVEGILDAYHLKSFVDMYYPKQFSITTGFTKSLSSYQENLLIEKNPKNIICMLDSRSWYDYYSKFKNRFPFDVDYVILPNIDGKESDPNSLSFKQLNQIFINQIL